MKIFLIGLMGSGKSHWAKKLSKKLKTGGYDLDFVITSHEERSIAEIFAEEGEANFRKTESKLLRWFAEKKSFVLATGGGTPCFNDNMDWMNTQGITIWLDEPVQILAQRLLPEKAHRPLIAGLPDEALQGFLREKLEERRAFYSKATYHLKEGDINDRTFAKIIKEHA
ncbi:shikimate kinase [Sediminibacterium ginsengisoli]|uniref:Shikimate kinase n=1 Tax=Sediminibacterium ginsengisoli TaxID=413434 RepID=A0A1T4LGB0_9BACT|nr:shikimate kinase [Sediminibacterium ginsengisoli]SJZ53769.1 shikimate kinase [Sediminibacterium ginsengisoli]